MNNVRFWSMVAIVAVHSISTLEGISSRPHLTFALLAPFKFGTIAFFLISGFLLGERVDRDDPIEYFMRRVKKVFLPWAAWFCVASALFVLSADRRLGGSLKPLELLKMGGSGAWFVLITSSFWFVPNLLFCIAILLMFRKYLYSPVFGAVLMAANLVYVVNIYALWFRPQHTQAMFGFVFYLWLGSYAAHEFERFSGLLARIPATVLLLLSVLTGIMALLESNLLFALNNPDPANTLRFSNQIFSVCVVLLMFKIRRASWPRFVDVRRHTFGIYLCHPLILPRILYPITHGKMRLSDSIQAANAERILLSVAVGVLTYCLSLGLTMLIERTPSMQWTIGLAGERTAPRITANVLESEASLQGA